MCVAIVTSAVHVGLLGVLKLGGGTNGTSNTGSER
jgi:hypothetical protein